MATPVIQDVVFRYGTKGLQAATSKMGKFNKTVVAGGAALGAAAVVLGKMIQGAEGLAQAMSKLSIDVDEAMRASAGLVDTMDLMAGAAALQNANIEVSANQFRALTVAAEDMAQKAGKGAEEATANFNRMVEQTITASEDVLLRMGETLSQTSDKAAAHVEILEKVARKYGDVSVDVETTKERLASAGNSLETIVNAKSLALLDSFKDGWTAIGSAIGGGSRSLREYEADIISTNGEIARWEMTVDGVTNSLQGLFGAMIGHQGLIQGANEDYKDQVHLLAEINRLQRGNVALAASIQKTKAGTAKMKDENVILDEYSANLDVLTTQPASSMEYKAARSSIKQIIRTAPSSIRGSMIDPSIFDGKTRGAGGGGGRDNSPDAEALAAAEAEIAALNRQMDRRLQEELRNQQISQGIGIDPVAGLNRGTGFQRTGASGAAGQSAAEAGAGFGGPVFMSEDMALAREAELAETMRYGELKYQAEMAASDKIEKVYTDQMEMRRANILASTAMMGQHMGNFASLIDTQSERGFNAAKALRLAELAVTAPQAVAAAYTSGMEAGGPAGPAIGAANAALTGAFMAAQFAKIASTKYSSGKTNAKVGNTGAFTNKFNSLGRDAGAGASGGDLNIVINTIVDGQTVSESLVRQNDLQKQAGNKHFVTGGN